MLQHETEHNNNYASELKQLKQNNLINLCEMPPETTPENKETIKLLWQSNGIYKVLHSEIINLLKEINNNKEPIKQSVINQLQAVKHELNNDLNDMPNGNYLYSFESELIEIVYNNVELIYLIELLIIRIEKEFYKRKLTEQENNKSDYHLKRISDILENKEPITPDIF